MTIKGISLIMAAIILSVYQLSRFDPTGALFSFISSSLPVNIALVALSALMVRLSFMRKKFSRRASYAAVAGGAVLLGCFGAAGIVFPAVDFRLYSVFKPLDFFVLLEAAIVMIVCVMTYEHPPLHIQLPLLFRPSWISQPTLRMPKAAVIRKRALSPMLKPVLERASFILSHHA